MVNWIQIWSTLLSSRPRIDGTAQNSQVSQEYDPVLRSPEPDGHLDALTIDRHSLSRVGAVVCSVGLKWNPNSVESEL